MCAFCGRIDLNLACAGHYCIVRSGMSLISSKSSAAPPQITSCGVNAIQSVRRGAIVRSIGTHYRSLSILRNFPISRRVRGGLEANPLPDFHGCLHGPENLPNPQSENGGQRMMRRTILMSQWNKAIGRAVAYRWPPLRVKAGTNRQTLSTS